MKKTMIVLLLLFLASTISWAENNVPPLSNERIYHTYTYKQITINKNTSIDTSLGDVIFEMDVETPTNDNQILGVEFDGTYFYLTGGASGAHPNKVYVVDTLGNLVLALDQPEHIIDYWGWRDLTWDGIYAGADRIDTLYGSVDNSVDKFGIDLMDSTLDYYESFLGPRALNRALAYKEDSAWFFTGSSTDSCYKFSKTNHNIQAIDNYYHIYGAAYDTDVSEGDNIWWHSQDSTTTPFLCLIEQMDANDMEFTGVVFAYVPTIIDNGLAGGLCFYEDFRGMDVLFALVQGDPVDIIVGIFVRFHTSGIAYESAVQKLNVSGFTSPISNPIKGHAAISYTTTKSSKVSLKIYDNIGRFIRTLVDKNEPAGTKTVYWDGKDNQRKKLPSGVYFIRFVVDTVGETQDYKDIKKVILLR